MPELLNDLRRGAVNLWRNPTYSAVAVVTLAVGIGASIAMFTVIQSVLLRPLPYERPEELVMLWHRYERTGAEKVQIAPPDFLDFRERSTTLTELAALRNASDVTLTGPSTAEHVNLAMVTANLFDLLGWPPTLGRSFIEADERLGASAPVILSHGFWVRQYGADEGIIGQTIELRTVSPVPQRREVVGVLPEDFQLVLPHHDGGMVGGGAFDAVDIWSPVQSRWMAAPQRGYGVLRVLGRLGPGASLQQARDEMTTIAAELRAEHPIHEERGVTVDVVPLHTDVVDEARPMILALFGAVGIVLLIACANVANLALVRGSRRAGEVAIRAALGGTRSRIIRELLAESTVLALAGGVLGMAFAAASINVIVRLAPADVPRMEEVGMDGSTVLAALGACAVAVLLSGVVPALRAASPNLMGVLRDGTPGAGHRGRGSRSVIVGAEVALSMVLLVAGGLLVQTFTHMADAPLGFRTDNTMTAKVSFLSPGLDRNRLRQMGEAFQASVEALPGVEAAGYAWPVPFSGRGVEVPYSARRPDPGAAWGENVATRTVVSPSYFATLGARVISGRSFTVDDVDRVLAQSGQATPEGEDPPSSIVVIDDLAAQRLFPGADPVGRMIWIGTGVTDAARPYEVIGVVGHIRHNRIVGVEREAVFMTGVSLSVGLVVRTAVGDPRALLRPIEERLRELDPQATLFEARTFTQSVDEELAPARFAASLALVFAILALGLAAVGLYGVIAYSVSQRTRDIGVRLALGAGRGAVLRLVFREGIVLVVPGVVVGAAGAYAASRVIESLLYGVSPADIPTFTGVAAVLSVVAGLASYLPARRAARIDPVEALRVG